MLLLEYRVLSLPGSLNYQVALKTGGGFYTGNDPILSNVNKPFIAPYSETTVGKFNHLFDSVSQPNYLNLLGLYNIRKIVVNKDMYPWFGFGVKESSSEIEMILDKDLSSSKNQIIDLYDAGDYFLPRFYVPQKERRSKDRASSNLLSSFEQHLFFAAKRISEIQKWVGELDDREFTEVLDRYKEEMYKAILELDAISLKEINAFPMLLKIEVSFGAHEKRLLDVLNGYYLGQDNERIRKAESVLNNINNQLISLVEKYYLPIKYKFDIPETGEYEILAKKKKISPDWKIKSFNLNDSFIASASTNNYDENWLSFGKRQFAKGQHFLTFTQPSPQNLLDNKNWKKLENNVELGGSVRLF